MRRVMHFQIRFVKRIEPDKTIITFPNLGKIYELHNQKTLKGHNLSEAIARAIEFNPDLPHVVRGMVIVDFKSGGAVIAFGRRKSPYLTKQPRKRDTTEWLRFIDRSGSLFEVDPLSHKLGARIHGQ